MRSLPCACTIRQSDNDMGLAGAQSHRSTVTVTLQVYYLFTVLDSIFTHIYIYIYIYSKYKSKKNSINFHCSLLAIIQVYLKRKQFISCISRGGLSVTLF